MRWKLCIGLVVLASGGVIAAPAAAPSTRATAPGEPLACDRYAAELERYLRGWLVDAYPQRATRRWHRDYRDVDAFLASVEPNRQRWRAVLNPPDWRATGPLQRRPHPPLAALGGEWLTLPLGAVTAEALLVVPAADRPVPLVIAQHGIGGTPERVFGIGDERELYHAYGRALVAAGFAVLAPMSVSTVPQRNRIERLCRLGDTTLAGIELVRMQRLLDVVLTDPRIDARRVGMWGFSLGGMATMFWMPLEPRIRAGVVSAWFNDRPAKMAVSSDRYLSFLDSDEEHAFVRGWLTEFADEDVVSLICPRPMLIETGKRDPIADWRAVVKTFEAARRHYERLGLADRMEMRLHDGGHEVPPEPGVRFLAKWLRPQD